ncbi:LysR family transcriptional regulator ArgP [Brevundimonas pondensis]|uniref:LysR family transcriptional regulator ArgP n=1 Tax=Brevundimonas pondensis TaxID=2774189 RepID=UPI003208E946
MLDYPALAALAAVIRTGSFDAAAETLSVTPSAVSQRVKGLEERLGLPLVIRGTPCRPTEAGARLAAHLDQVTLLEHDMLTGDPVWAAAFGGARPTLKIALNADSLGTWFPGAAARFAAVKPNTLSLVLDDEADTAERLRSGEVIAAVTTAGKAVAGCRTLSLGSLRYVAAATPDFRDRYFPDGVTAERLAEAPVLRFSSRDRLQLKWTEKVAGQAIKGPTHWVPSTQGFLDFTLASVCWSLTPERLAAPLIASGRLVDLVPGVTIDVPLFWQHLRITARLIEDLTKAVREEAADWLVVPEADA